jgi:hypothetical protein
VCNHSSDEICPPEGGGLNLRFGKLMTREGLSAIGVLYTLGIDFSRNALFSVSNNREATM